MQPCGQSGMCGCVLLARGASNALQNTPAHFTRETSNMLQKAGERLGVKDITHRHIGENKAPRPLMQMCCKQWSGGLRGAARGARRLLRVLTHLSCAFFGLALRLMPARVSRLSARTRQCAVYIRAAPRQVGSAQLLRFHVRRCPFGARV